MIDGEVVAIDESGRVSFNALQHSRMRAHTQLYVFDLLVHRGRNVMHLPLETRRALLADALGKVHYPVIQSRSFDVRPGDLVKAAKELGLEGVIAKRKGSFYEPGLRSGAWVKYKINRSQRVRDRRLHGREPVRRADRRMLRRREAPVRLQGESGVQSSAKARAVRSS
jgi:bifunctional non-homologous end joining protein LigD